MDALEIDALRDAIRRYDHVESRWVDSVAWTEVYQGGEIVWQGDLHVFRLENHPTAKYAYAWWYGGHGDGVPRQIAVVLEEGPLIDPVRAFSTWITALPRGSY